MKFIGRKQELKDLSEAISAPGFRAVLIYGRTGIGKTWLAKKALTDAGIPAVFYSCRPLAGESIAADMGKTVSEALSLPVPECRNAGELLDHIFRLSEKHRMVLVLDEYQCLRESVSEIDSILGRLVGRYRDMSRMTLILTVSCSDVMEPLPENDNYLFGRTDLAIALKPMDCSDSAGFYPGYSAEDRRRIFSVFGGVTQYLRLIDDCRSVKENIIELVASDGARLGDEVQACLRSGIKGMVNANEVLMALSRGCAKFSDILRTSHVSSGSVLADVLKRLMRMGIVEKTAPENSKGSRGTAGYRISDSLTMFCYRYIFSRTSELRMMDADAFYERYIAGDFETVYVPERFMAAALQDSKQK